MERFFVRVVEMKAVEHHFLSGVRRFFSSVMQKVHITLDRVDWGVRREHRRPRGPAQQPRHQGPTRQQEEVQGDTK